jgi:hypothetical protein
MLAVHRIFQMIFGVIVSATILYFLITYSGNYAGVQKDKQRADILVSFTHEARSVYLTGISSNFTHFFRYNFSSCYVNATENIPEIICPDSAASGIPVDTPVIFQPGSQVYISRDSLDYGWWVFGFAEAMPSTVFVLNPTASTEDEWEVMRNVVKHLPDTSDDWSVVRVTFAFCDGSQILYVCGGKPCGKTDFLSILSSGPLGSSFSPCTAPMGRGMRLVSISAACGSRRGVCINPPNSMGVGNAFVEGSAKTYVYKDPLDLVALAVGGAEKDDFGRTGAEKIYTYKNSVLMTRLSLASQVMSKRAVLIAAESPAKCGPVYIELSQVLDKIPASADYLSVSEMYRLNENLNEAKQLYQALADMGCERVEYGA